MKMQKGLCIKIKNGRSIFLIEDGRFLKGRAVDFIEVGEEGYFLPASHGKHMALPKILAPIVAIAAALILLFATLLPSEEAFAYIQLEAEPGIEFGIDENINVISIRQLNDDGKVFLDGLGEWEGRRLNEVLARSIAIASSREADAITITMVVENLDEGPAGPLEKSITTVSMAALSEDIKIHLKKATLAEWRKSVEEEVPVGQKVKEYTRIVKEENPLLLKDEGNREIDIQTRSEKYTKNLTLESQKKKEMLSEPEKKSINPVEKPMIKPINSAKESVNPAEEVEIKPVNPEKDTVKPVGEAKIKPVNPEKGPAIKSPEKETSLETKTKKAQHQVIERKSVPVNKEQHQKVSKENQSAKPEKSQKQPPKLFPQKNK